MNSFQKLYLKMQFWKRLLSLFGVIVISAYLFWKRTTYGTNRCNKEYNSPEDFEGFDNETGTENGCDIVPNYVHFVRYEKPEFTFVEAVCVLAAFKNQKPDIIFFHTNTEFKGKYWNYLLAQKGFKEIVKIVPRDLPTEIYGQELTREWVKFHGSDIARIQIMMEFGGIYLDNDCFIVKSLNSFFKYEITISWQENLFLGNQVIIANQNARFLREWILSYKGAYKLNAWYYNAGERPTQEILYKKPHLIHRMKKYFNDYDGIFNYLYIEKDQNWRNHYVFHLLIRHLYLLNESFGKEKYPVDFDEVNIKNYSITFRDMVASVYPLYSDL